MDIIQQFLEEELPTNTGVLKVRLRKAMSACKRINDDIRKSKCINSTLNAYLNDMGRIKKRRALEQQHKGTLQESSINVSEEKGSPFSQQLEAIRNIKHQLDDYRSKFDILAEKYPEKYTTKHDVLSFYFLTRVGGVVYELSFNLSSIIEDVRIILKTGHPKSHNVARTYISIAMKLGSIALNLSNKALSAAQCNMPSVVDKLYKQMDRLDETLSQHCNKLEDIKASIKERK